MNQFIRKQLGSIFPNDFTAYVTADEDGALSCPCCGQKVKSKVMDNEIEITREMKAAALASYTEWCKFGDENENDIMALLISAYRAMDRERHRERKKAK